MDALGCGVLLLNWRYLQGKNPTAAVLAESFCKAAQRCCLYHRQRHRRMTMWVGRQTRATGHRDENGRRTTGLASKHMRRTISNAASHATRSTSTGHLMHSWGFKPGSRVWIVDSQCKTVQHVSANRRLDWRICHRRHELIEISVGTFCEPNVVHTEATNLE